MSQTGIILNVQQQLEDILNNQGVIVQNQHDMFEKLGEIEKRLINVELLQHNLMIQQNTSKLSSQSSLSSPTTGRSSLLPLTSGKSSASTANSASTSASFLRQANLSTRLSQFHQNKLMMPHSNLSLMGRSSLPGFATGLSSKYTHLSKRAKYELKHHNKELSEKASTSMELEEGEKPADNSQHDNSGENEAGEIHRTKESDNEEVDDNEDDDDDDNDSNISSSNLNIMSKTSNSTSPSNYLKQPISSSSTELLMLATDETTGQLMINDSDIRRIFAVSKSRGNFAALLVQHMYGRQERIISNVMGTRGKRQLSPRRMIVVKRLAFKMYPPPNEREEEIIWKKECVKAIDSKNRKVRIQPGGHRNVVLNETATSSSASNSANTSLNRATAAAIAAVQQQHQLRNQLSSNPFQAQLPPHLASTIHHHSLSRQTSASVASMAAAIAAAAAAAIQTQTQTQSNVTTSPQQPANIPSSTTIIKHEANTSPQMVTSSTTSSQQHQQQKTMMSTSTPNKDTASQSQGQIKSELIKDSNINLDNISTPSKTSSNQADNDNLTDTSFNEADN